MSNSNAHHAQESFYINWKPVRKQDGKIDKIPTNGASVTNRSTWLTFEQAKQRDPEHIGVILTGGLACLDVDDALVDGNWTPVAHRVLSLFPDCATEISQSGRGLHVFMHTGKYFDAKQYMNKPAGEGYEFYAGDRFIALGRGLQGDWVGGRSAWGTDAGSRLAAFLKPRPAPAAPGATAGSLPPHVTDEMIVAKIEAQRTAGGTFGTKAPPAALWSGAADVLAGFYPSDKGDPFDHSGADMALLGHLRFWCHDDPVAMDRLFRQSGLMRDKWDSARGSSTYGTISIGRAVAIPTGRYAEWRDPNAVLNGEVLAPGAVASSAGLVRTFDLAGSFQGCTYVVSRDAILMPDGRLLNERQFNGKHGGKEWPWAKEKWTTEAFKAFTRNQLHPFPKADETCLRPDLPFGVIEGGEVNAYMPRGIKPVAGDVTPFLRHVEMLLPDAGDRKHLLDWMAHVVQRPGTMTRWAPALIGPEGNGKSFLMDCIEEAIGAEYTHKLKPQEISATHNGWIHGKLFARVEEIKMSERREILEDVKAWITDKRINVRAMRTDSVSIANVLNFMFATNHSDGVIKTRNGRRFAIFRTTETVQPDKYFTEMFAWAESGGYAAIADYLLTRDVVEFPKRAPDTSSTAEAIEASYGKGEQFILEAIEDEQPGLCRDWASSYVVRKVLEDNGMIGLAPKAIGNILENLDFVKVGRAPRKIEREGMTQSRIWVKRSVTLAGVDWFSKYSADQGYPAARPAPTLIVR